MKKALLTAALVGLLSSGAWAAGPTGDITVNVLVDAIDELTTAGGAVDLHIIAPVAGSQPDPVTDSSTATYAISTNQTGQKITAGLDEDMPTGLTLKLTAAPTAGNGTTAGKLTLAKTGGAVTLVTAIGNVAATAQPLSFELTATLLAAPILTTPLAKTITLTIVAAS